MGLFKKSDAIGKEHRCVFCGKKLYELTNPSDSKKNMNLIRKGYKWDSMYKCSICGNCACQNCMTMFFNTKCDCHAELELYPVAIK